ncbi:MAG TPA: methyl-accepting chemotaxis protein [Coleofasciculaceae cyanobacterium]
MTRRSADSVNFPGRAVPLHSNDSALNSLVVLPNEQPRPGLGVKTKATILAVLIGTIPVLIVGGLATYFASQTISRQTLSRQQNLAVEVSLQMGAFVEKRLNDVETIASNPIISDPRVRSNTASREIIAYLDGYLKRDPSYSAIAAATPEGAFGFLGDERIPLRNTDADYPSEVDAPGARPLVERKLPYFLAARDTLQPAVSPLRISTTAGQSGFYIAAPSINPNSKQLSYVIFSRTFVPEITKLINRQISQLVDSQESGTIGFRLVDHGTAYFEKTQKGEEEIPSTRIQISENSVKIDNKPFEPGGAITAKQNRVFVSNGGDSDLNSELDALFPSYQDLRNTGKPTTLIDKDANGDTYVLAYAPIPKIRNLPVNWGVLIYQPTSVAFAPERTLTLALLLGTAIAAAVVGSIAATIANRVTRPIVAATDAVVKIGQGDLGTRLDIQGQDEIASLGYNINSMADQLQKFLEAQVLEAERERLLVAARGSGAIRISDLQEIFKRSVRDTRMLFKLDRVAVYQINSGSTGEVIAEAIGSGLPSAFQQELRDNCIPPELYKAYQQGRIVAIDHVAEATLHPEHLKLLERLSVKASLVVPILGAGQLFGLLIAHDCSNPHLWQETEINFMRRLGNELGLATFWATLLDETEKLAEEQRQLKESLQKRAIELLQEVEPISQGDLTTRARVTDDEIGTIADSYNSTVDNLRKIIFQVQSAANQVVDTASTSETLVQKLSAEALKQAEEISVALDVVQELDGAVQAVAVNAEQAEQAVQLAANTVAKGDAVMNRTVEGIQAVQATVTETAKKVKLLGESSEQISAIVDLITTFASQTNLLAFNATIEASRAGEAGRGFAAIASEVQELARQSKEALEEINKVVDSIQIATKEVVQEIESGITQAATGTSLVNETRQSLNKITEVSVQIGSLVEAIARATVVQSQASATVTQTMIDVAAIANQTSTEADQASSSFEQLREVAKVLQQGVGRFKLE